MRTRTHPSRVRRFTADPRVRGVQDRLAPHHLAALKRLGTYLVFGGLAAVVNLATQALLLYVVYLPLGESARNLFALLVANEVSILANFVPNDRFTFRQLAGARRVWWVRCLRFHLTALTGAGLAVLLQILLHEVLRVQPILANALAIAIVLGFNFTMHHLFTYRHVAERPAHPARPVRPALARS